MGYKFDSIVNNSEAAALKEMIFRRARERSQDLNEGEQADIMNMARESFVSKDNPFSRIIESNEVKNIEAKTKAEDVKQTEIGFPIKEKPEVDAKVKQNQIIHERITAAEINNNMAEAREALTNKKSFMGALNFLNSQAAVSLMRTRADKFEIVV